jgi:hypothetical protein
MSAESVSESEKNFVDPNPKKKFSDPQHWCWQSADKILPVHSLSMSWKFSAESLFLPWRASIGSPRTKNPPDGNNSRIPYSEGSLQRKHNFLKLKHENNVKMKNKPYLALLRLLNLSN